MAKSPYKFLDSYTSEDRDIFFGREKEIEELYYKVAESNILVVYGSSGTGKTSLIQCGLASKFQDADWLPVLVRKGGDINESLKKALANLALTPLRKKNNTAQDIQSVYLDHFKPIYILFDQFEELFIFGSENEIDTFIDNLKLCLDANLSCRYIFILRGEYLENLARFEEKIPNFFNNRVRIERMTRVNAANVITGPANLFGIKMTDGFAQKVLDRLSGNRQMVELTYLQVYIDKLYKIAVGKDTANPVFDDALLQQVGQIDDILGGFLDEQLAKAPNPVVAMAILKAFVSNDGTKRQMAPKDVCEYTTALGHDITPADIEANINQFVGLRIIKDKDEDGKFELRHDALAAKIYEQISNAEKELIEVRQFIMVRYQDFVRRSVYLMPADIDYIRPYYNKALPTGPEKKFVEASIKLAERKKKRLRVLLVTAGAALVLVLGGFTIFALLQRNAALQQATIAGQKTKEAEKAKAKADSANNQSILAKYIAIQERELAEKQKNRADSQTDIVLEQTKNLIIAKALSDSNFVYGMRQARDARIQKDSALMQKSWAEREKDKAIVAEKEATRLKSITLAQNLALKVLKLKKAPQLAANLAYAAYKLAQNNNAENALATDLYNAMYFALKNIDPKCVPKELITKKEIGAVGCNDKDGTILVWGKVDGLGYYTLDKYDSNFKTIFNISYWDGKKIKQLGKHITFSQKGINEHFLPVTYFISKDGKKGVTGYEYNAIKIWDINGPENHRMILGGHTGQIRAAAFSEDKDLVITGGRDSTLIIWEDGKLKKKIKFPSKIKSVDLHRDNNQILVGSESGVFLYNIEKNIRFSNKYVVVPESITPDSTLGKDFCFDFISTNSPIDAVNVQFCNNPSNDILMARSSSLFRVSLKYHLWNSREDFKRIDYLAYYKGQIATVTSDNFIHIYNISDTTDTSVVFRKKIIDIKDTSYNSSHFEVKGPGFKTPPIEISDIVGRIKNIAFLNEDYILVSTDNKIYKYDISLCRISCLLYQKINWKLKPFDWALYTGYYSPYDEYLKLIEK